MHKIKISTPSQRAMRTGMRPLSRSPSNVIAAAFLLPVRNMLVAPGLPDPKLRGSGRPIMRATKIDVDIEPIR